MDLYGLGRVPWIQSQLLYHALPRVGREALVICRPDAPYVSIGYHQDLRSEVDLEYCARNQLPVFRREVAGGTVYLDDRQVFYQLVLHRRNPAVPACKRHFFQRYLGPVMKTLEDLGVPARLEPPCDIHVRGRKISGNGGGEIGDYWVLVGNLLLDFDCSTMASVLRLPGEEVRSVVRGQMEAYMTTLQRETDWPPCAEGVEESLSRNFSEILPGLGPASLPSELWDKASHLEGVLRSRDWLFEPGRRLPYREVKIVEGTFVYSLDQHAMGRPGQVVILTRKGRIREIRVLGPPEDIRLPERPWRKYVGKAFRPDRLRKWARTLVGPADRDGQMDLGGLLAMVTD